MRTYSCGLQFAYVCTKASMFWQNPQLQIRLQSAGFHNQFALNSFLDKIQIVPFKVWG
jgi:hypothetical protein